jgi:hypothetical protein
VPSARHTFTARLWRWEGAAAWYFVSLPHDVADEIADMVDGRTGGFGSVRVDVLVGSSRWSTSLFPDSGEATYLLPVKKAVRRAESLDEGADVQVQLTVAQT